MQAVAIQGEQQRHIPKYLSFKKNITFYEHNSTVYQTLYLDKKTFMTNLVLYNKNNVNVGLAVVWKENSLFFVVVLAHERS